MLARHLQGGVGDIWAAGFFDGEGCIYIRKYKVKSKVHSYIAYNLVISVGQMVPEPLFILKELFGGAVYQPYYDDKGWLWKTQCKLAYVALLKMVDYMSVKQDQARVAMKFQERRKHGQRCLEIEKDEADYLKLQQMKIHLPYSQTHTALELKDGR